MKNEEILDKRNKLLLGLLGDYFQKRKSPYVLEEDDFKWLYGMAKAHKIGVTLFFSLDYQGLFKEERIKKAFESFYASNLKKNVLFEQERESLFAFLNDEKIDFLPLKGIILNGYYPEYGMREFADNDILFDKKYARRVRKYFVERGYKVELYGAGAHDVYIKEPVLNFEMHRTLFDEKEEYAKTEAYFANILKRSKIKENHEKKMSDDDYYLYFIAHTYKHFSHGGCGIRTLLDIALLHEKLNLDRPSIDATLKKLDLYDFEKEISSLGLKVYKGETLSKEENELFAYIASSGAYGTLENSIKNALKKENKAAYLFKRIFPPLSYFRNSHPIIFYSIIGIPFLWLARLLKALIFRRKKVKEEIRLLKEHE